MTWMPEASILEPQQNGGSNESEDYATNDVF